LSKKSLITLTIISVFMMLYLIGCGGGDGVSTINPNPNPGDGTGSIDISVDWPDLNASDLSALLIHPNVTKIRVTVYQTGGTLPGTPYSPSLTTEIARPSANGTISGVPLGKVNVHCEGLDAGGNIISSRLTKDFQVNSGSNNLTAILGVTIMNSTFVPKNVPISPGDVVYWGNADTVQHIVQFTTNARTFTLTLAPGALESPTFTDADLSGPITIKLYNDVVLDPALDEGNVSVTIPSGQVYAEWSRWGLTADQPHNAVDGHLFIDVDKNGNFYVAIYNPQIPLLDPVVGQNYLNDSLLYIPGEDLFNLDGSATRYTNRIEKYDRNGVHAAITFNTTSIDQIVGIAVDPDGRYLYIGDNQMDTGDDSKSPANYTNIIEDRIMRFNAQSGGSPQDIIIPPTEYNNTAGHGTLGPNPGSGREGGLYFDGHFPQGLAVSPDSKYLFVCDAHVCNLAPMYEPMVHKIGLKLYDQPSGADYAWYDAWINGGPSGWPYRTMAHPSIQALIGNPGLILPYFLGTTGAIIDPHNGEFGVQPSYIPVDVAVSGNTEGTDTTGATVWFATWGHSIIQRVRVTDGVIPNVTSLDSGRNDITGCDLRWATSTTTASDFYIACLNSGNGIVRQYNGVGGANTFTTVLTGFITGWPGSLNGVYDYSDSSDRGGGIMSLAIAKNQDGTLYIGDDYHRVTQFARSSSDAQGTYAYSNAWRLLYDAFNFPTGIAYDNTGNHVYITDRTNCRVIKFNSAGVYQTQWGIPPHPSDNLKPDFWECEGMAMFLTDRGMNQPYPFWPRFTFQEPTYGFNDFTAFNIIDSIVASGAGLPAGAFDAAALPTLLPRCNPGEFFMPQGIAVSHDGQYVYVVDWALNSDRADRFGRVQKFRDDGTFITSWDKSTNLGEFIAPKGIAIDKGGFVYVSWFAGLSGLAERFLADGTSSGQAYTAAPGGVAIERPEGLAIDYTDTTYTNGILYLADKYNHRVIKYNVTDSALLGQVGTTGGGGGTDAGEFRYPNGLAVDNQGYVYVVDSGNKRIQKFSSNKLGNGFVAIFTGAGNLLDPWGIAVAPDGSYAFVADSRDNRVVIYKAEKTSVR